VNEEHRYRVAVFARNEEKHIVSALLALLRACPSERDLQIYVLVNGCTDRTLQVVQDFARTHTEVSVVELPFGDKSHAWNAYVYEIADDSPCHFFTDSDVECSPGALERMQSALLANVGAMAIGGVPMSGRHRDQYLRYMKEWHWLFGNLYAIRNTQLVKLRNAGARLPIGLCGSDHFVSKLAAAGSLAPTVLAWEQNTYRADAGYVFRSLNPFRWRDVKIYAKRRTTYALRQLQIPELDTLDLAALPATMDDVNRRVLKRLEATRLKFTDVFHRAVRRKLRSMYPAPDAAWFERLYATSRESARTAGR
jgi:glycosyltransferase involved in cell wall biosynthesis